LYYDYVNGGSDAGIRITGAAGGPARLIGTPGWFAPDWQPNDSSFVFLSYGPAVRGIGIVDTFGVSPVTIRDEGDSPKWSPDGARIAFLSRAGAPSARDRLWLMNRDGSGVRQLTPESVLPDFNWSPDSKEIAYTR